jgi:hypothetical protein
MLGKLPGHQWPTFSRGDSSYGSESIMLEHQERGLPYLFKLRHTPKVKELVVRMMRQGALWQDCGDGWQALETTICLSGWTRERRIVLVRESPARAPVARIGKPRRGKDRQNFLPKTLGDGWDAQATPWSGKISVIAQAVTQISKELHQIRAITERSSVNQRWTLLPTRLLGRWLGGKWLPGLPAEAELLLSG